MTENLSLRDSEAAESIRHSWNRLDIGLVGARED